MDMTQHELYNIDDDAPLPRRADHSRVPLAEVRYTPAWLVGGRWLLDWENLSDMPRYRR